MMRLTRLPRFDTSHVSRKALLEGAWKGTSRDYRGTSRGRRTVLHNSQLWFLDELPDEELIERYVYHQWRVLMKNAKASDLSLYEVNPDKPDTSVLFAGSELLFWLPHSGWNLGYFRLSDNLDQSLEASKYAQVVAHLNRRASADEIVAILRDPESWHQWRELERSGRVQRHDDGEVTIR